MLTLAVIFAATVAAFKNVRWSLALFISLLGAVTLANSGLKEYHFLAMLPAFFVCIVSFDGGRIGLIPIEKNEVNYLLAILYGLRVIVFTVCIMGLIAFEVAWVISTLVFLVLQIALVIGGAFDSHGRIDNYIGGVRGGLHGAHIIPSGNKQGSNNRND